MERGNFGTVRLVGERGICWYCFVTSCGILQLNLYGTCSKMKISFVQYFQVFYGVG